MTPLRENYLIQYNEFGFDTLFAKINIYNYNKVNYGRRLNESRFNSKYDIRLTLAEQESVKDFFKIVESKMINSYSEKMNEGFDFAKKIQKIKQFFEALSKMVIGTVSEFINKIVEMLNKLGQKVSEFIDNVFGFDGFDSFSPSNDKILDGVPQSQLGFIGAVEEYCKNNLKSPEIKKAASELGNVNEGFSEKLDNWLKTSKILNSKVGKLILGDREKVGGGKISLWKTIGVSIVGSLLLCTIIPLLVSPLGTVGVVITVACKVIWVSRGVLKVLHHRSKTKREDQKLWSFWTIFQIILVVGTPILFAIPGVKDAVNNWMNEQINNLGLNKFTDKIAAYFGMGETKTIHQGWKEIEDPDIAQNAVIGKDAVSGATMSRFDSFRQIYKSGGNIFDYIKKVTSDIGLDKSDATAMTKYMKDFNKLDIKGPDIYDSVFGKLQNCKTMQLAFDTSVIKRTFGTTENFTKVLFDRFKEEGLNVNNSKFYNLINQAAWENSGGNRGAIDVISLDGVKASSENIEAVNKVLQNMMGDKAISKGHTVIGVLNSPVKFVKTVANTIRSFIPKWEFGAMYMPMYKQEKKNLPAVIPPKEIVPAVANFELILHNEETNKDYPINKIDHNVKMSEVKQILNDKQIQKTVNTEEDIIDAEYEEIKESLRKIKLSKNRLNETDNLPAVQGPRDLVPTGKNELTTMNKNEIVLRQKGEIIQKEQNALATVKKGEISVSVFFCEQLRNKLAIAFCSPGCLVGVNPIVAENSPSNLFKKGLFKYYTFKVDKSHEQEFRKLLTTMMFDSVMKTYEILKFSTVKYKLIEERNGQLYPGEHTIQGNIELLGNFTVQEFCDIHNGKVDPYIFYDAKYANNISVSVNQNTVNTQSVQQKQITGPNPNQKRIEDKSRKPRQVDPKYRKENPHGKDQRPITQKPQQPITANNINNITTQQSRPRNNNQQNSVQPKQNANNKKQSSWYKKFWNWLRGKNESFNPDKKMTTKQLYEILELYKEFQKSERL